MKPHILMIFLDGVGLGDDVAHNPFAVADLPTLHTLSNGKRWLHDMGIQKTARSLFIPADAQMGVAGLPQSGTGQATIITGRNIPQLIGEHYGPKDVIGHRGTIAEAIDLLTTFDGVMKGMLSAWDDSEGVVIITSDHGNIEDIGNRRHTDNRVPTVIIGEQKTIFDGMDTLADIAGRMWRILGW